ncbi:hypothetical protein BDV36DRAFT_306237 [Aspergillus pseudocaelatus]|uniref:Zn(2)-C6 fungal-type domain-containing protein n=1 Tax=Aspergillus pseudocaelatus TaxID=1825620 RepID=A0ABQ6WUG4_9EURO|nr:hypothetical protein BDV36DRAFT_306237 [Aspergillus pseudocaelatus]
MRTTLACQWCRKSKVKCHHDGTPPCKSCRAHPGRECSLSTPIFRRKRNISSHSPANTARANRVSKTVIGETSASRRTEKTNTGLQNQQSPTAFSTHSAVPDANGSSERQSNAPQQLKSIILPENALENVDQELVIRASRIFAQQFPEFGFVHKPTFFEYSLQDGIPAIKLCAIMALCARYIPEMVDQYGSPHRASEYFANVVRENIMSYMAQHPGIDAVHAMILLSLYDWAEGNGFQAWIYTGDLEKRGVQFQTPFTAFCIFSAASVVLYMDTWPYMAPGLENAKEKYIWSSDWLKTASEKWEIAKRWYEILGELRGIFTRLKTDGHNFPHLGREQFQDLHDNLHRLAEPESSTVNALAALSQHAPPGLTGSPRQYHLGSTRNGRDSGPQASVTHGTVRLQEVHNSTSEQSQADLLALDHGPQGMDVGPGVDIDFLMAMLSDPSGDWSHVI